MKLVSRVLSIILLCFAATTSASDLLMVRSQQGFPEAMLTLQTSIREHGYAISRVQRIDIGLTGMGYKTDKYRIVFVFDLFNDLNDLLRICKIECIQIF